MSESIKLTYRNFLTPIPPPTNLSNISTTPPSTPCSACQSLVPDRSAAAHDVIPTPYVRTDTFPDFPALLASAETGCGFCELLRSTLRSTWGTGTYPAQNYGVEVRAENDSIGECLEEEWDGSVRLEKARFGFVPFSGEGGKMFWYEVEGEEVQKGGNVVSLEVDVVPVWPGKEDEGAFPVLCRTLKFDVFDSVGEFVLPNFQSSTCKGEMKVKS